MDSSGANFQKMSDGEQKGGEAKTQKALIVQSWGLPKQGCVVTSVAMPGKIADDEMLVRVFAASLNPIDWKFTLGNLKRILPIKLPSGVGGDFSGMVEAVGSKVTKYKKGDEVWGFMYGFGSVREYIVIKETVCALKPACITHDQAASAGIAGLTAWKSIEWRGQLKAGQKFFVTAGAGGVGMFAIQQASKVIGAEVATTCSSAKSDIVKGWGATTVVDYKTEKFEEKLKNYDLALDCTAEGNKIFKVLRKGGTAVTITGLPNSSTFEGETRKPGCCILCCLDCCTCCKNCSAPGPYYPLLCTPSVKGFEAMNKHFEEGKVKIVLDKVFPLDKAVDALEYLMAGRATGKVVVHIVDEPKKEDEKKASS